jgi:hypothetical protein
LAGRWIAWSADGLRIIGSGATLKEAEEVASAAGELDPIFEVAPGPNGGEVPIPAMRGRAQSRPSSAQDLAADRPDPELWTRGDEKDVRSLLLPW